MKNCEICGKLLPTRKIFNVEMPTYEGHEGCLEKIKEQEATREKERFLEQRKKERLAIVEYGFAGASINWKARTFDTWAENSENKPVVEFLKGWEANTKGAVLSGTVGVGKTHLLAALATWLATERGLEFKFVRFSVWSDRIRSVGFEQAELMICELQSIPLLFLDDLGASSITDHIESKFCRILDHRLEFNLPVFISTNITANELQNVFSQRIVSRLTGLCDWIALNKMTKDWRANR